MRNAVIVRQRDKRFSDNAGVGTIRNRDLFELGIASLFGQKLLL